MNRWRQRLAELHDDAMQLPAALPRAVRNVQKVQNPPSDPTFEHFKQIEQRTEPSAAPPAATDPPASPAPGEPPVDLPVPLPVALPDPAPTSWAEAEEERAATGDTFCEPVLLRDGRRLWRFPARAIPDRMPRLAETLIAEARWSGAVLVADGSELIVVERWLRTLPEETLGQLRDHAGEAIAALRRNQLGREPAL